MKIKTIFENWRARKEIEIDWFYSTKLGANARNQEGTTTKYSH